MIMHLPLAPSQIQTAPEIEDLYLAAAKMQQVQRGLFQVEMTLKYCGGNACKAEPIFD